MHTNTVPIHMPSKFPFDTFPVMGVLRAIKDMYPTKLHEMIDKCFHEIWHLGHHELDRERLASILQGSFSTEETARLLEVAYSKQTKQLLAHEAKVLVDEGAFGFPWIVATRDFDHKSIAACVHA